MLKATNAVWADFEARIEAEFRAEEMAWKQLETGSTPENLRGNSCNDLVGKKYLFIRMTHCNEGIIDSSNSKCE